MHTQHCACDSCITVNEKLPLEVLKKSYLTHPGYSEDEWIIHQRNYMPIGTDPDYDDFVVYEASTEDNTDTPRGEPLEPLFSGLTPMETKVEEEEPTRETWNLTEDLQDWQVVLHPEPGVDLIDFTTEAREPSPLLYQPWSPEHPRRPPPPPAAPPSPRTPNRPTGRRVKPPTFTKPGPWRDGSRRVPSWRTCGRSSPTLARRPPAPRSRTIARHHPATPGSPEGSTNPRASAKPSTPTTRPKASTKKSATSPTSPAKSSPCNRMRRRSPPAPPRPSATTQGGTPKTSGMLPQGPP